MLVGFVKQAMMTDLTTLNYQRLKSDDDDHGPYEVDGKKEDKVANIQ